MKQFRHYDYVVSTDGRVFRKGKASPLKPDNCHKGYQRVTLSIEGKTERFMVHRMVAECYLPNPDDLPYINHIDNDPTNNSVDNIEWCTHSGNMLHCHKQGRCSNVIASDKAKELAEERRVNKFKGLLGANYISTRADGKHSWITYACPHCNRVKESRSDSKVFDKQGLCRKCSKDEDIVSSYMKV